MKNFVLLYIFIFGLFGAQAAQAENGLVTFTIQSHASHAVNLKFYSKSRNAEWPGVHQHWVLSDHAPHSYKLNCQTGENICYGAGYPDNAKLWGVGTGKAGCHGCCLVCRPSSANVRHSWTLAP